MSEAEDIMKAHLGVPKEYKASINSLYKVATRFSEMTSSDEKPTPFGMVCWLDIYGDFTSKKDIYSKIVNEMFTNMGSGIMEIMPFIEYCQNGYKELDNGD